VKFCTKQIAKYTDRLFLFIFIFHILAKWSFAPNKTPNIPTDYSFLFLFFTFLLNFAPKKRQIHTRNIPFYIYFSHFGEVKFCTKQIAKYTDRLFLFIFIFHIFAKFRTQKTPDTHTEYSFLYLFFTFWRSFAAKETPNIPTDYSFLFFIFHILAKVRTKKTQRPLGLEGWLVTH
jgi:hypothetical protein